MHFPTHIAFNAVKIGLKVLSSLGLLYYYSTLNAFSNVCKNNSFKYVLGNEQTAKYDMLIDVCIHCRSFTYNRDNIM